jgi:hypothetical protein
LGSFGLCREVSGTSGHFRALSGTFGHFSDTFRTLSGTFGHFRALSGTIGHYRALSGTMGHYGALWGTIGHYRALLGTSPPWDNKYPPSPSPSPLCDIRQHQTSDRQCDIRTRTSQWLGRVKIHKSNLKIPKVGHFKVAKGHQTSAGARKVAPDGAPSFVVLLYWD